MAKVEQGLVVRAQERWDALMAGDVNKAYEYISPAGRLKMQAKDYRLRINTSHIKKVVVKEAKCKAELCEVMVFLDYTVLNVPTSQVFPELWILDEGKWWFVYRG